MSTPDRIAALVYRGVTGGRYALAGELASIERRLASLERAYGGVRQAAAATGVSTRTWQRWKVAAEARPGERRERQGVSAKSEAKLKQAMRRSRLGPRREQRVRQSSIQLHVKSRYDEEPRTLDNSNLDLAPGTADRMTDAYLVGDDAGMADALLGGVRDAFYAEWLDPENTSAEGFDIDRIEF